MKRIFGHAYSVSLGIDAEGEPEYEANFSKIRSWQVDDFFDRGCLDRELQMWR